MRWGWLAAFAFWTSAAVAGPTPAELVAPAPFDFYVLTLSWSPNFCESNAYKAPDQCGTPNGFVVHGLWPDNANRPDPSNCGFGRDYVPATVLASSARVFPSRGLAIHEWRTHGTCTGLGPQQFFRAVKYARDQFTIPEKLQRPRERLSLAPEDIAKAFMAVNANLTAQSLAVTCERGELVDVRFCMTKDLRAFAICPKVARRTCREDKISVAPVR